MIARYRSKIECEAVRVTPETRQWLIENHWPLGDEGNWIVLVDAQWEEWPDEDFRLCWRKLPVKKPRSKGWLCPGCDQFFSWSEPTTGGWRAGCRDCGTAFGSDDGVVWYPLDTEPSLQ